MIAKVLTGRRATWIVLAFSLIALVLLAPVTGKLKSVQNDDSINYLPRGAQSTQVQQILADLPGGNTADAVVVYARTGGLTGPDLARVAAARTAVADLAAAVGPVVRSADWQTWYQGIRKAMAHQAITTQGDSSRTTSRLVHAHCARRHPDDPAHSTDP